MAGAALAGGALAGQLVNLAGNAKNDNRDANDAKILAMLGGQRVELGMHKDRLTGLETGQKQHGVELGRLGGAVEANKGALPLATKNEGVLSILKDQMKTKNDDDRVMAQNLQGMMSSQTRHSGDIHRLQQDGLRWDTDISASKQRHDEAERNLALLTMRSSDFQKQAETQLQAQNGQLQDNSRSLAAYGAHINDMQDQGSRRDRILESQGETQRTLSSGLEGLKATSLAFIDETRVAVRDNNTQIQSLSGTVVTHSAQLDQLSALGTKRDQRIDYLGGRLNDNEKTVAEVKGVQSVFINEASKKLSDHDNKLGKHAEGLAVSMAKAENLGKDIDKTQTFVMNSTHQIGDVKEKVGAQAGLITYMHDEIKSLKEGNRVLAEKVSILERTEDKMINEQAQFKEMVHKAVEQLIEKQNEQSRRQNEEIGKLKDQIGFLTQIVGGGTK